MNTTAATLSASSTAAPSSSRGLNIALWAVQGLLAFAFLAAGLMKMTTPIAELAASMAWVENAPAALVRFIGFAEFAGAVGLLAPAITRIKPMLTPAAAVGLLTVMVLAASTHASLGEFGGMVPSLVLGSLAAFVAWGRGKAAPIAPR